MRLEGDGIAIAKVQIDDEQRYRKQVQVIVEQVKGRLRPAAKANLKLWQRELGIADEKAAAILAEVLKPYEEKAAHVKFYRQTLIEEKEYGYPLDDEAVEQLQAIKRRLNLRDEDVSAAETKVLGTPLSSAVSTVTVISAAEPQSKSETEHSQPQRPSASFSFETVRVNDQGKVVETIPCQADYYTEALGNGITLEMVRIPEGKFLMGAAEGEAGASDDEYPQREVSVPEFWLGKYAVTQVQWRAVAALPKVECDLKSDPANFKGDKLPVEQVSWDDAIEFCKRLSQYTQKTSKRIYTLPSEAQWEYACRARTTTPFHFGPTITTDLANYRGAKNKTSEVGSFSPNAFGLYDMHGNLWEWCLDDWHDSYKNAPTDGSARESSSRTKVLRGGSWRIIPAVCRAANRDRNTRVNRNSLTSVFG